MIQAEIITIGDELLIGQVVDTNSAWMAQQLNERGIAIARITSVHDSGADIREALDAACQRADVVLLTGGLGPTKDDITKAVLCDYFQTQLTYREDIHEHLLQLYQARPDVLNRLTDTQCLFPANAELIWNRVGSAQVMLWSRANCPMHKAQFVVSMPGVPYEMMWVMEHGLLERLSAYTQHSSTIVHRTLQVYGIAESSLALLIEEWETNLPETMHLAYLPKDGIIRLRLSGYDVAAEDVEAQLDTLRAILGTQSTDRLPAGANQGLCFADEDLPLEQLVGRRLKEKGQTISSAESCTGGKIAHLLNKHAGSSAFYMGSVVAYDNRVKQHVLGVEAESLNQYGAVSEAVVRQMAEGVRSLMQTDYAIATSGIAGPDGGTPQKPVGTVWMAIATPDGTFAHCFQLGKLREQITDRAAQVALLWLLRLL